MTIKVSAYVFVFCLGIHTLQGQNPMTPPGKLVDVNGYKLHLMVAGEEGPAVVMFHGAGDIGLIWNLVLPEVGKFGRAVAVDQSAEGWSEHGHSIHMWQQAYDTHQALINAGIEGPYILVGHSLGGLLTRVYANMYPDEVAGVILVDATHPDVVLRIYKDSKPAWKRMRETSGNREIPAVITSTLAKQPELTSFQGRRDFGDKLSGFSRLDQQRFHWIYNERPFSYVKGRSSYEAETMQLISENAEDYSFGNKPLFVISKGIWTDKEGDEGWSNEALMHESKRLQLDLLSLSTNSKQIIAEKSGHQIHLDQPELVVEAIREMLVLLNGKK
ncbi:MAG: alpha/beta hydrolase [Roseivirga sp.]|nr:alpha/beta hydrolase [Roseivirga sp.]